MNRKGLLTFLSVGWISLLLLLSVGLQAAPDDGEAVKLNEQVVNNGFEMNEANFDQWVFQNNGNAKQAREKINVRLKLQLDELNRICQLTDTQKQKLTLAASSDIKRFFDEVEVVRKKFMAVRKDQNAFNNIWQDISPLQQKMSAGLFGSSSFFAKSIPRALSAEQAAKYDVVLYERRQFRYRASIEVSLTNLESTVAMRHEQHETLVKWLLEETKPPLVFGTQDNVLVMFQLAKLPESKLRPLFDEAQWKVLQVQLNQNRQMGQYLISNGVLAEDDEAEKPRILKQLKRRILNQPADATIPENKVTGA